MRMPGAAAGPATTVAFLVAAGAAWAATIHVPGDFGSIGEAIAAASDGDSVVVAAGSYTGPSNRNLDFAGRNLTVVAPAGAAATIIECGLLGRGFHFHSGEDSTSVVAGFMIRNGMATRGGGIACEGASPRLVACRFERNIAVEAGAGLYCAAAAPTVRSCLFVENTVQTSGYGHGGGGMHCNACSPRVISCGFTLNSASSGGGLYCAFGACPAVAGCTFEGNVAASVHGGAVFCYDDATAYFDDCRFMSNTAARNGGGLYCEGSSPVLSGCDFVSNQALGSESGFGGGGIYVAQSSSAPLIRSCEFIGNQAARGGGINCRQWSSPLIESSTFVGNTAPAGGGMYCREQSTPEVMGCVFSDGSALSGGGLYADDASPLIRACAFWGNAATGADETHGGGALHLYKSTAVIDECAFIANVGINGGALHARGPSTPEIGLSTFAENQGEEGAGIFARQAGLSVDNCILAFGQGEAVVCLEGASVTLSCSDVFGNSGGDWVGCIGGQLGLGGNISADPLFCGGSDPSQAYALQEGSPCAPESSPCGQMGRWGVACEATTVTRASWGGIKAMFR